MNTQTETTLARDSLETQITIVSKEDGTRANLLQRLDALSDEGIVRANSFVVATLAEKVQLDVEMLFRFLTEAIPVTEVEVA